MRVEAVVFRLLAPYTGLEDRQENEVGGTLAKNLSGWIGKLWHILAYTILLISRAIYKGCFQGQPNQQLYDIVFLESERMVPEP